MHTNEYEAKKKKNKWMNNNNQFSTAYDEDIQRK